MNVILNVDEVETVLMLVTSQVLDHVDLSDKSKDAVRSWRRAHSVGTPDLDEYAEVLNEAIGNHIDERTTRMLRRRGKMRLSAAEERTR